MPSDEPFAATSLLLPDWTVPPGIGAAMSLRSGGISAAPWHSLNLGDHVGDAGAHVAGNRQRFAELIGAAPVWLNQVHGTRVLRLSATDVGTIAQQADAAWTDQPGVACTVLVADCLPVLFAAPGGVAAAHAGWRGLAGGVLEAALFALCRGTHCAASQVSAWLGPCIGARQFEVGEDVVYAFGSAAAGAFVPQAARDGRRRWLANLPMLARARLQHAGVQSISGGIWCTFEQASSFFSYRRDGVTGRHAAAVWLTC